MVSLPFNFDKIQCVQKHLETFLFSIFIPYSAAICFYIYSPLHAAVCGVSFICTTVVWSLSFITLIMPFVSFVSLLTRQVTNSSKLDFLNNYSPTFQNVKRT